MKKIRRLFETTQKRRLRLARELATIFSNTVAYGPLKGLKLAKPSWGGSDRSSMLLGTYEFEVQQLLETESANYDVLIDLGAADGFFGVGALVNKLFSKSYCFEINSDSREALVRNAKNNGVESKIVVLGKAEHDFYAQIPPGDLSRALVIVDIEGGEFTALNVQTFAAMQSCLFVIELHEDIPDAAQKVLALTTVAEPTHSASFIQTGARDLSNIPEVRHYKDTDRWLMCSESRPYLMRWMVLRPKN